MLELTHTFEPALERARERARSAGVLTAREQEALLSLPGFDGGPWSALQNGEVRRFP